MSIPKKLRSYQATKLYFCKFPFLDTPMRFRDHLPLYAATALYRNGAPHHSRSRDRGDGLFDRHASPASGRNSPVGSAHGSQCCVSDPAHAEEHTSELQSQSNLVSRLLLETN